MRREDEAVTSIKREDVIAAATCTTVSDVGVEMNQKLKRKSICFE